MPTSRAIIRRTAAAAVGVFAAIVMVAAPAGAHGADGPVPGPFEAVVTSIEPDLDAFDLAPGHGAIDLHVVPDHAVTVLGYQGEPYLLIDADGGVYYNALSPTYYVNSAATPEAAAPDSADADAEPEWTWLSSDGRASWHDHRLHWMNHSEPEVAPREVAQSWTVDLVVDGTPVAVNGDLIYDPSLGAIDHSGHDMGEVSATVDADSPTSSKVPALAVAGLVAVVAAGGIVFLLSRES